MDGEIYTGLQGRCHIQGIAVDEEKKFIYCSFTTKLIKYDFCGRIVGSVTGLTGHMGCISFCKEDGRVYGSLEYKNDCIGRGIHQILGVDRKNEDAFYLVSFNGDKITRENMDAGEPGIMTAMYLKEATDDYLGTGTDKNGAVMPHKFGCSGVDGTGIGYIPGEKEKGKQLLIAYGVYNELNRNDNDHQVILCYSFDTFKHFAKPLLKNAMHHSGPDLPDRKFFVYTGNTDWGVQNLEYDDFTGDIFLAVYHGFKPDFKNYDMFRLNGGKKPYRGVIKGTNETGELLTLKNEGMRFAYGSTGMYSFGDGRFLFSRESRTEGQECSYLKQYRFSEENGFSEI